MKKTALILGGLLSLSLVVNTFAQTTTNVYSKNAVGYISIGLPAGFSLIGIPLRNTSIADLTFNQAFGSQLPDSTLLYIYDSLGGRYLQYIFVVSDSTWYDTDSGTDVGENIAPRGAGFWINVPSVTNVQVVGEVPGTQGASETQVNLYAGFTVFSNPYPTPTKLIDSDLKDYASNDDCVYAWDGSMYKQHIFVAGDTWYDTDTGGQSSLVLDPGKAYWYYTSSAKTASERKPYDWP